MDFKTWFTHNYPNDSLSIESLEFIEKDISLRLKGNNNNPHWCWVYLNGNRQFVFKVIDEYLTQRRK